MDAGSIVLAAALATVGWSIAQQAMRWSGRGSIDVPMTLGRRLADDPQAAFAVGLVLHLALGVGWGIAYALAWMLTGWPIAPLQGALFSVPHWVVAELAIGLSADAVGLAGRRAFRPRRAAFGLLVSHVVYGIVLGLLYRPGA